MFACSTSPHLLLGRHMDQLVVCSVYVVCKVSNQLTATFNNIINEYARQKKDRDCEWREIITKVKIKDGASGDVIKFYNEVFIEKVKGYVFSLTGGGTPKEPASEAKKMVPTLWCEETLEQYLAKRKLTDADQWLNSIKTKTVYIFGKSSSKKLDKTGGGDVC